MRFMIIGKSNEEVEAGAMPSKEFVEGMREFGEALAKAGVLLAAEGLHPTSRGAARISYADGAAKVIDGPFAEAKELIAGFWLIQVKALEEAVQWALRIPVPHTAWCGEGIEIRQVFDPATDWPDDLKPATTTAAE